MKPQRIVNFDIENFTLISDQNNKFFIVALTELPRLTELRVRYEDWYNIPESETVIAHPMNQATDQVWYPDQLMQYTLRVCDIRFEGVWLN